MLSTMTCDICKRRYLVRPSRYTSDVYRNDIITFTRLDTKDLDVGGDSYTLRVCPECFAKITKMIAYIYDLDHLKNRVEYWERQVERRESNT